MRKYLTFGLILFWSSMSLAYGNNKCELYPSATDSIYIYRWSKDLQQWPLNSIQLFEYQEELLTAHSSITSSNRSLIYRWEHSYDINGNRTYSVAKSFSNGELIVYQKKESVYDSNNRKTEELVYDWKNQEWIFRAKYIYYYFPDGKLQKYTYQLMNSSNQLYDNINYFYTYSDDLLTLVTSVVVSSNRTLQTQEYIYNDKKQVIDRIVKRAVNNPSTGQWDMVNSTRVFYFYNVFGVNDSVIFKLWENNEWVNYEKYVYFKKIDNAKKVELCKKGKQICVAKPAVPAQLNTGATLGKCPVVTNKFLTNQPLVKNQISQNEIAFEIFPNPSNGIINITGLGQEATKISVVNRIGNEVRSSVGTISDHLSFDLSNLPAGLYIINVYYGQTYITRKVILQ